MQDEATFLKALVLLDELAQEGSVIYTPVIDKGAFILVIPSQFFHGALSFLKRYGITGQEIKVTSINELPPKEQARLRGLTL